MLLLHTTRLELEDFIGDDIPKYAILSHTWGDGEVLFRHVWEKTFPSDDSAGSSKIRNACAQAVKDGWEYIWVDTCCINKESSAELSEAINSMYKWYEASEVCYAYLSDVSPSAKKLKESRWFTRGWTLQELLAPTLVKFYDQDWHYVASKDLRNDDFVSDVFHLHMDIDVRHRSPLVSNALAFLNEIAEVTSIDISHLLTMKIASIAQKMSWLARRQTKRGEDIAYCMLGLFDVNMPLLYGEGKTKAFFRLQSEILKISNDDSIFAWNNPDLWCSGLLADSPRDFIGCEHIMFEKWARRSERRRPPSLTSLGVEMQLSVTDAQGNPARSERLYSIDLICDNENQDGGLFLLVVFDRQSETAEHILHEDELIVASRTKLTCIPYNNYPILRGKTTLPVYFRQRACPKSSSWQNVKVGATSWSPSYNKRSGLVAPAVNLKLGCDLDRLFQRKGFYQDFSNLRKGPQRIGIAQSSDVTLPSNEGYHPCGLLFPLLRNNSHHILLRWCPDSKSASSLEILYMINFDPDNVGQHRGIQLPSKDSRTWFFRKSGSAKILFRRLLRDGDASLVGVGSSYTLWVSSLNQQDPGQKDQLTIEIDMGF